MIGAVLCQNIDGIERPIMYLSQALNEHELKYGITDKEGLVIVWAVTSCTVALHW